MRKGIWNIYFILLFLVSHKAQALTLIAKVSLNGITGTVTFNQNGGDTTVNFQLTGLSNQNTWQIYTNRMVYDRQNRCTDSVLGNSFLVTTGTIPASGSQAATISTSVLQNLLTLTGRTILIIDSVTSSRVCATIESEEDHVTAVAKLQSVIGGTVYFRKATSSSATSLYTNAFHLQNTATAVNEDVVWGVYMGTVTDSGVCTEGSRYNPTGSSGVSCDQNNQQNCEIGDLSSKLSNLPVGATSEAKLASFVDTNLPLSGSNSIVGKILVIKASNGTLLSCAKIVQYSKRSALMTLSRDDVTGTISFEQSSPFDPTSVSVSLSGLGGNAGGYHIHKWPVPEMWTIGQSVCSNDYVSGHFNPFSIDTNSDPAPTLGTDDQYEVGDLSSKFGMLTGLNEKIDNYTDYNLQLFGSNSVIGRSVVVHYSNGSRWVCANIEYVGNTVTGVATFTFPVIGHIVFKQSTDIDLLLADTMIYTALNYGDTTSPTTSHNWHVHVDQIGNDGLNDTGRCMSVKGHYNPFSIDLEGNYVSQCNPLNPLRCEVGDMSGKHGQISVRTAAKTMQRNFFTDFDLPLRGDLKILGRSIVIHAANSGGGRLSCANIYNVPNRKVIVQSGTWAEESSANAGGTFTMERNTEGLIAGTTKVNIQLTGLAATAGGYHIHMYPVPRDNSSPCSAASVGGHFNPFSIDPTAGAIDGSDSDDEYEIGDLSRKYGAFLNTLSTFSRMETETMLPLRGPLSVTGRSVVIHKSSSGNPRWVCGNITEDTSTTGGSLYEAKATFATGTIRGSIYLTQYMYSDGSLSDTGVLVDLVNTDGSKTTGHNWHVHVKPVGDDATSGCATPGGHYNPFKVDLNNNYDECSLTNQLRCELGDQSGKLGQYDIGDGRRFYTDVNLPLVGQYGVAGKSFVVHAANSGAARLACADILPVNKVNPMPLRFESMNFDKSTMVNVIASALSTSPTNLAVSEASSDGGCMESTVYFTGPDASTLRESLHSMINKGDPKLGAYVGSSTCSSCIHSISILCLMLAFVIQRLTTTSS